jgi:predicted lipoprotein
MMRILKYLGALILVLLIGYNSVYFRKLSEVRAGVAVGKISTEKYTRNFWDKKLIPSLNKAIGINELIQLLKADPEKAFKEHAHALGIGNLQYFMIKGEGQVSAINENDVELKINGAQGQNARVAVEYVYGNAVRDASGLLNMNEFDNTAEFNDVSAGINKIIRNEVLPSFKKDVAVNDKVQFVGAIELNRKFLNLNDIEITPVQLKLVKNP